MYRLDSYYQNTFTANYSSHYSNYYNSYSNFYGTYGNYFNNYYQPNYAPTTPEFTYISNSLVRGQAKSGDLIAAVRSFDANGDSINYYLSGNHSNYYSIDAKTGYIYLTSTGAYAMNNGYPLPSINVIAHDGRASSSTSTLQFSDPEPVAVNHAPQTPVVTSQVTQFVKGQAKIGDIVAKASAKDIDGDQVTYHLAENPNNVYMIDAKTGVVTLSARGVAMVNAGQNLPDLKVLAYDGQATSEVGRLDVADTIVKVTAVNHAPQTPVFTSQVKQFVKGQAKVGDIVAKAAAKDIDGDQLSYYLVNDHNNPYVINHKTGVVSLSSVGVSMINAGQNLPDLKVVAYDGKAISSIGTLDVANTVNGHVDRPTPTPTPTPTPSNPAPKPPVYEPVKTQFEVDTRFHDSRDLNKVELPYFIKILNGEKSGYLHKTWDGPGSGANISYEFATSASDSGSGYAFTVRGFQKYSNTQKQAVRDALKLYEEQTNLKFTEKAPGSGGKANFKFYMDDLTVDKTYANNHRHFGTENTSEDHNPVAYKCNCASCSKQTVNGDKAFDSFVAGYAYFGGDVHMNSTKFGGDTDLNRDTKIIETVNGRYTSWISGGFGTLIHEIGHSVGLTHPFDGNHRIQKNSAEDKSHLTMMSYSNDIKEHVVLQNGQTVYTTVSTSNFGIFDLAALHYRFGVNKSQHAGDTTYTFKDFNPKTLGNDIYIWDGSGNDTFDGSAETQNLYVNLTPGSWIYRGDYKADTLVYDAKGNPVGDQMFIGFGTQIENLKGGRGNDILIGNETNNHIQGGAGNDRIEGGAGKDWLEGGAGNDILIGGSGQDILVGGTGKDKFVFNSLNSEDRDVVLDFNMRESDSIVLDANVFGHLGKGMLRSDYFVSGANATAKDSNDHIIFDTVSKQLYYDADGNGSKAAVAIAQFKGLDYLDNQHIHIESIV